MRPRACRSKTASSRDLQKAPRDPQKTLEAKKKSINLRRHKFAPRDVCKMTLRWPPETQRLLQDHPKRPLRSPERPREAPQDVLRHFDATIIDCVTYFGAKIVYCVTSVQTSLTALLRCKDRLLRYFGAKIVYCLTSVQTSVHKSDLAKADAQIRSEARVGVTKIAGTNGGKAAGGAREATGGNRSGTEIEATRNQFFKGKARTPKE